MIRKLVLTAAILGMATGPAWMWPGDAGADVLYLKNGNVIHGTITQQTDAGVKIKIGKLGEMSFRTNEISNIESNALDYKSIGRTGAAPAPAKDEPGAEKPAADKADKPLTEAELMTVDQALAKLKSDDPKQCQQAEDALAAMGPKVFDRLEKSLGSSGKPMETAYLMSTMRRVDSKRALAPIMSQAENDAANEMTRQAATVMLGEMGDKRATGALLARLIDKKYYVRRDAATALGSLNDQKALPMLVKASDDNDIEVRNAAMGALKHLTKMEFKTGDEWRKWWGAKAGTTTQ